MNFHSSNEKLNDAFKWAVETALSYVIEDRKCCPCYEAALPRKDPSYCMRDTSHQALGAHYLGLDAHNKNMILQFCKNISESRDFCSFWEITCDGEPCPDDYEDDAHFWYNLPANFDIMRTCDYLYEITGDEDYLTAPEMKNFHELSVSEYVDKWDRDGDGIVDRVDEDYNRGICSYDEGGKTGYKTALDTLSLQWKAYVVAAKAYRLLDDKMKENEALGMAEHVRRYLHRIFYFKDHFGVQVDRDDRECGHYTVTKAAFPLICGILTEEEKKKQLKYIIDSGIDLNIEELTYLPEVLFGNGYDKEALDIILKISAPDQPRREYPEVSYAVVGDVVSGYMGISPSFTDMTVKTRFGGGEETAEISEVSVFGGTIDLKHDGKKSSTLKNNTKHTISWEAEIDGVLSIAILSPGEEKTLTA